MDELTEIEKCQYDQYRRTHQGTPGCGGTLLVIALFLFVMVL